jgi:hypothetical protein
MTTSTKTAKVAKTVQVIARYQINRNNHVVYTVRSSSGADTYTCTLVDGKATGCSCPSHKPCYHMTQLEAREAARREKLETARAYRELAFSEF